LKTMTRNQETIKHIYTLKNVYYKKQKNKIQQREKH